MQRPDAVYKGPNPGRQLIPQSTAMRGRSVVPGAQGNNSINRPPSSSSKKPGVGSAFAMREAPYSQTNLPSLSNPQCKCTFLSDPIRETK